jgi:hypothetical protein
LYNQTLPYDNLQDVFNSPSFNPAKGCQNASLCNNKGGMLVFLQGQADMCEKQVGRACDDGCIIAAVIGSVFGALLLGVIVWFFRKSM